MSLVKFHRLVCTIERNVKFVNLDRNGNDNFNRTKQWGFQEAQFVAQKL